MVFTLAGPIAVKRLLGRAHIVCGRLFRSSAAIQARRDAEEAVDSRRVMHKSMCQLMARGT